MDVTIQPDAENDLVYVALSNSVFRKGGVRRTLRVDDDISLDFDQANRLLGVEIMNASSRLGGQVGEIRLDALVGVSEASALLGVRPSNFVRDYPDRIGFPSPVAELASGRVWLKTQLEEYRRSRRRRPRSRAS